jgi:adenosine deaminase
MPRPKLDPRTPLTELHVHLGAAVTPAIMWGIAHAQGIRLPTKDYWAFRDLITAGRRRRSFQSYLDLFFWTELIQSSPIAVERSVYEVIGGAYRKNLITGLELRFNPMKRNRGGEQDLDHIIAAAVRGMDRAVLEYPPIRAGLIFCLDRSFPYELNEIIAAKAIAWRDRGVVAVDIAGPDDRGFRFSDYRDLFAQVRRAGLGVTVHAGETGGADEVRAAVEALEPTRIGHGVRSVGDARVMALLREREIVLEICPSSNLVTRVLRNVAELRATIRTLIDSGVRFAISTDGPEMLRSYLRDEIALLLRHEILTLDEARQAVETAQRASFLDRSQAVGRPAETNGHGPMEPAALGIEVEV